MLFVLSSLPCTVHIFQYNGANIQLLDLPGIIEGASKGKMFKILNKGVHLTNYEKKLFNRKLFFSYEERYTFCLSKKTKKVYVTVLLFILYSI